MKKIFTLFILLIFLYMPAFSQTLTGGVEYTVDEARLIAFDNSDMQVSKDVYEKYLINIW